MADVFIHEQYLTDIADSIRTKLNTQDTYKVSEMADAIDSISGGSTINNQNKTVHPSSSQQSITADSGYTGLGTVTVKGVTVENLSASNIVSGVTVKIGDADDDDSIASVTGTASSGSAVASGTFTPESDILTASFDVGDSSRTHFLICAASTPYGNSKRVSSMAFVDFTNTQRFLITSNSSGSSAAGSANFASIPEGFSMSGSTVTFTSSGSNSNQFSYFIGGVTYRWYAW